MSSNFKSLRITGICIIILISMHSSAQQNVRKLINYSHETSITPGNNKVTVRVDEGVAKTFALIQSDHNYKFKSAADKKAFLDMLQLSDAHKQSLSEQYNVPVSGIEEKLLARAIELKGLKLANKTTETSTGDSNTVNENANNVIPEVLTSTNTNSETSQSKLFYWLLIPAMLLGLAIGFWFGKKKRSLITQDISMDAENDVAFNTDKEVAVTGKQKSTRAIEEDHRKLQKKYDLLLDESEDRKSFDRTYFSAIDKKIVAHFWNAVNNKDEQKAVEYALKSAAQLTAITRLRLDIEQSFDQGNIDEIMGKSASYQQKSIDQHTHKDTIPDHAGTIISILQQHRSKGLGNTNFQGYTLNNLDT